MALWDAKDPRWLVSQRQDGANVNGWHWEEKNLMGWSKAKLDALLAGLPAGLDSALGHAKLAGVKDLTGEVGCCLCVIISAFSVVHCHAHAVHWLPCVRQASGQPCRSWLARDRM